MTKDRIEDMLTQLLTIVGNTNARLAGLEDRIAGLEDRIAGLEGRIAGLEDRIAGLEGRVAGLEDRVADLQIGQAEIKSAIHRIEHRLDIIDRRDQKEGLRLDNVEAELELLQERVRGS
ncbi:MAG: hypothetical protein K6T83_05435 [Alicyclobacillus sp.]|nr:hypothetical protein [Alicyclobacillus sp.]